MSVKVVTHLNFRGNARVALEFYLSIFGGEINLISYRDAHIPMSEKELDNIMWGNVLSKSGFQIMAYDVPLDKEYNFGENAFFV